MTVIQKDQDRVPDQIEEKTTETEKDTRLPVTLLSGFLGSGKTTLLSYILKSKDHGLRCAVIVNDMGALNIDASLVKNHKLTQKEEKIVQMQNGCICCTLRADLLEEIANLAEVGEFDYLIIESSGISEPIQVAETFTSAFADTLADSSVDEIEQSLPVDATQSPESRSRLAKLISEGGLNKIARLDTCVSVVDSTRFMDDFETVDFLTDRHGVDVGPEDERNITDLLTDQIEFANVILLNKTDMMPAETVDSIEKVVKTLNPTAKVYRTSYSETPLTNLINTGLFDFGQAAMGAGWLQSLREESTIQIDDGKGGKKTVPKPETLEYGIGSFVYSSRRPFHPSRLWDLVCKPFCVLQPGAEEEEDEEDEDEVEEVDDEDWKAETDVEMEEGSDDTEEEEDEEEEETPETMLARMKAEKESMNLPARAAFKKQSKVWKGVLRSKGFCWLATRPGVHGEWSQAGVMFTLGGGGPWMCTVPESEWPTDDPEVIEAIKTDFMGTWGDRRQELVFIGQDINQELIKKTLDAVTLNDKEWAQWEKVMRSKKSQEKKVEKLYDLFDDGWEVWPDHSEEHDHEHDHGHGHGHGHKPEQEQKAEPVPVEEVSMEGSPKKRAKMTKKDPVGQTEKVKAGVKQHEREHGSRREKKTRVARAHQ